jgi:TP53 regulating kinase-like protein
MVTRFIRNDDTIYIITIRNFTFNISGQLHEKGMVHGDPTTSNVMLKDEELVLLDLGLGSCEAGLEEKAVDLYVLERAVSSTHPNLAPLLPSVLTAYANSLSKGGKAELARLEEVKARGRKRSMVG